MKDISWEMDEHFFFPNELGAVAEVQSLKISPQWVPVELDNSKRLNGIYHFAVEVAFNDTEEATLQKGTYIEDLDFSNNIGYFEYALPFGIDLPDTAKQLDNVKVIIEGPQSAVFDGGCQVKWNVRCQYEEHVVEKFDNEEIVVKHIEHKVELPDISETHGEASILETKKVAANSKTEETTTNSETHGEASILETKKVAANSKTEETTAKSETHGEASISETKKVATISKTEEATVISETPGEASISETPKVAAISKTEEATVISETPGDASISETPKVVAISKTEEVTAISEMKEANAVSEAPVVSAVAETRKVSETVVLKQVNEVAESPKQLEGQLMDNLPSDDFYRDLSEAYKVHQVITPKAKENQL